MIINIPKTYKWSWSNANFFWGITDVLSLDGPRRIWIIFLCGYSSFFDSVLHGVFGITSYTTSIGETCGQELLWKINIGTCVLIEDQILLEESDGWECIIGIAIGLILDWSHGCETSPIIWSWGTRRAGCLIY